MTFLHHRFIIEMSYSGPIGVNQQN